MFSKQYFINTAKLINEYMQPNKLYNSRQIYKLIKHLDKKLSIIKVQVVLKYAIENNIINYDREYVQLITYWKKENPKTQFMVFGK